MDLDIKGLRVLVTAGANGIESVIQIQATNNAATPAILNRKLIVTTQDM